MRTFIFLLIAAFCFSCSKHEYEMPIELIPRDRPVISPPLIIEFPDSIKIKNNILTK